MASNEGSDEVLGMMGCSGANGSGFLTTFSILADDSREKHNATAAFCPSLKERLKLSPVCLNSNPYLLSGKCMSAEKSKLVPIVRLPADLISVL